VNLTGSTHLSTRLIVTLSPLQAQSPGGLPLGRFVFRDDLRRDAAAGRYSDALTGGPVPLAGSSAGMFAGNAARPARVTSQSPGPSTRPAREWHAPSSCWPRNSTPPQHACPGTAAG
jgi:hypothetical protein